MPYSAVLCRARELLGRHARHTNRTVKVPAEIIAALRRTQADTRAEVESLRIRGDKRLREYDESGTFLAASAVRSRTFARVALVWRTTGELWMTAAVNRLDIAENREQYRR